MWLVPTTQSERTPASTYPRVAGVSSLAATNKSLAQSNKSRTRGEATKKRNRRSTDIGRAAPPPVGCKEASAAPASVGALPHHLLRRAKMNSKTIMVVALTAVATPAL